MWWGDQLETNFTLQPAGGGGRELAAQRRQKKRVKPAMHTAKRSSDILRFCRADRSPHMSLPVPAVPVSVVDASIVVVKRPLGVTTGSKKESNRGRGGQTDTHGTKRHVARVQLNGSFIPPKSCEERPPVTSTPRHDVIRMPALGRHALDARNTIDRPFLRGASDQVPVVDL